MTLTTSFFTLAIIAILWFIVSSIRIYDFLRKKNMKVSFLLLNLMIFSYVSHYKEITVKETGTVGPLFYHWLISINIAFILVVLGVIFI